MNWQEHADKERNALIALHAADPRAFMYSPEKLALPVRKGSDGSSKPDGAGHVRARELKTWHEAQATAFGKLI